MNYEELVSKVAKVYDGAQAPEVSEHLAIQFDISEEAAGAFYIEIAGGEVTVAPYDYMDRDVLVASTAEAIIDVLNGKKDIFAAMEEGTVTVTGDAQKVELLKKVEKKRATKAAPVKKAAKKTEKPAAKKAAAKKSTSKKASDK